MKTEVSTLKGTEILGALLLPSLLVSFLLRPAALFFLLLSGLTAADELPDQAAALSTENKQRPVIHFYCGLESQTEAFQAYEDLYRRAFDELNYDFRMSYIPSLRAISELNQGKADGDCGRIAHPTGTPLYNNLIRIKVTVARSELSLWSRSPPNQPITPNALPKADYQIGAVRGSTAATKFVDQYQLNVIELTSISTGLKMMHDGRIDLFIADSISVSAILSREPSLPMPYKVLIIEQGYFYPYLFKKHRHLEVKLTQVLGLALAAPSHKIHHFSGLIPDQ